MAADVRRGAPRRGPIRRHRLRPWIGWLVATSQAPFALAGPAEAPSRGLAWHDPHIGEEKMKERHKLLDIPEFPPGEKKSINCPGGPMSHSLARAVTDMLWARMWCSGSLNGHEIELVSNFEWSGKCMVHVRHIGGELRYLLALETVSEEVEVEEEGDINFPVWPRLEEILLSAAMRVSRMDDWEEVGPRLCLVTRRPGYLPLARPVPFHLQAFITAALNANRAVLQCNDTRILEPIRINGLTGPYPRSSIVGRAQLIHFSLPVGVTTSGAETEEALQHWVHVAVETFHLLDNRTGDVKATTHKFLGAEPHPCEAGNLGMHASFFSLWRKSEIAHAAPPLLAVSEADDEPEVINELRELVPIANIMAIAA